MFHRIIRISIAGALLGWGGGDPLAHAQDQRVIGSRTRPTYYRNGYQAPRSITLKLNAPILAEAMLRELQSYSQVTFSSRDRYPSFFTYLQGSSTVKHATGQEDALREKILQSTDHSVDPVLLLRWSLELNEGQLIESFLTVHETLRREARYYRDWVQYSSNHESMAEFFNKLIDIRGDLEERGDGFVGDHRGTWYRMWGTMLHYLYMIAPTRTVKGSVNEVFSGTKGLFRTDLKALLTSRLAEYAKPIIMYGTEIDRRKIEYNQKGYDVISALARGARGRLRVPPDPALDASTYLIPDERARCNWMVRGWK